jgi:hypothetical protein
MSGGAFSCDQGFILGSLKRKEKKRKEKKRKEKKRKEKKRKEKKRKGASPRFLPNVKLPFDAFVQK